MSEGRSAPEGTDDEPAPEEGVGSLYFSRASGVALVGMVMGGAFLLLLTTTATDWGLRTFFGAFVAVGVWMVLLGVNSWTAIYADRLEYATWRGTRVVLPFTEVRSAQLREGHKGQLRLRVVPETGKTLTWGADSGFVATGSLPLKVLVDALTAAGVEVDSLNYMGTGPYRLWWHASPPPDDE